MGAEAVAGAPVASSAGKATCAVITSGTPASTAARCGTKSLAASVARSAWTTGSVACESARVRPWPGACLAAARKPASAQAAT